MLRNFRDVTATSLLWLETTSIRYRESRTVQKKQRERQRESRVWMFYWSCFLLLYWQKSERLCRIVILHQKKGVQSHQFKYRERESVKPLIQELDSYLLLMRGSALGSLYTEVYTPRIKKILLYLACLTHILIHSDPFTYKAYCKKKL